MNFTVTAMDAPTRYALKKLKMEQKAQGFPITALREINTLLKAKHENICQVREIVVGSVMDDIFIVMEFVEHDLKGLLEDMKQPLLQAEVKTLMLQLLRGVRHLHDNWMFHRDLKTSNLLLSHRVFPEPPFSKPNDLSFHPLSPSVPFPHPLFLSCFMPLSCITFHRNRWARSTIFPSFSAYHSHPQLLGRRD